MAISMTTLKCPACNADLSADSGREFIFCGYCGTKVLLTNENEHIYRNIDEAKIKEAETDRMVRMKLLDMEKQDGISPKLMLIVGLFIMVFSAVIGVIAALTGNEGLGFISGIGFYIVIIGGMFFFAFSLQRKNKRKGYAGPNDITLSQSLAFCQNRNFKEIETLYRASGFTNITLTPINDNSVISSLMDGRVISVIIDGESQLRVGDVYPKNANIIIMYRSR